MKKFNGKKIFVITIFLGLFFQILASLLFSYKMTEESTWKPFYVERCRVSCSNTDNSINNEELEEFDDPWGIRSANCESYCQKHLSFGFFPYLSEDKGFNYSPGFNIINFIQNIIIWHGLALLVALPFSRKKKETMAPHH